MKPLVAALLGMALTGPAHALDDSVHSARWTRDYDRHFQKYTKRYFGPAYDWHWFKAQAIAESTLRHDVRSRAGAVGLMQILPGTFAEIQRANPHFVDIVTPQWNIAAGIWYDRRLYGHQTWQGLAEQERLLFAFAGYNAGLGGTLRAYRLTPAPVDSWERVAPRAPRETRGYVKRIVALRAGPERQRGAAERGIARQIANQVREPP
jgi:soluble lytic murein transglycosylase-like protein